jgi:phosphoribosylglycinamide formyltransferase-1
VANSKTKVAVLVSGNGSNLQALIDATHQGTLDAEIVAVISNKTDAYALKRAESANIPSVCLPHRQFASREAFDAAVVAELRRRGVQWVVFAGFMRLVTNVLLDAYPERIINIHPSLLPAFPGTDAIQQALDYGVQVTGCSVHLVTADMDAGPIIGQSVVATAPADTAATLGARIHAVEHPLLVRCVQAAVTGQLTLETRGTRRVVSAGISAGVSSIPS